MRRLAILLAGCAALLAGCDAADTIVRIVERQKRIDPPKLWEVQGLRPAGAVAWTAAICADRALHDGFSRADPAVNGQACLPTSERVQKPGLYAVRCTALSQEFAVTVTTQGDEARDFTVRYTLTPLDVQRGPFIQTLRYRLAGPCPKGWKIGDANGVGP